MKNRLHRPHWRGAIPVALAATLLLSVAGPAAAADPARPFLGYTAPGTEASGPPVDCPAGAVIRYTAEATGYFAHLGRVDFSITHCTSVDFATGAGTVTDGTITFVAANGDILRMSHHGTFQLAPWPNPTTNDIHMDWTVTGGTGRFAGATGSGEASAVGDLVAGSTTSVFAGTIAY